MFPTLCHRKLVPVIAGLFMTTASWSQGNGDAGLQSSGHFGLGALTDDHPTTVSLLGTAGLGTGNAVCLTAEYRFDWNVWGGVNIWLALPYHFTYGDLAYTHGLGDLRVMAGLALVEKAEFTLMLNAGGVVPSGKSDLETPDGDPLPMIYQPSQGSAGFMAGAIASYRLWSLAAGYQNHLSANDNGFTKSAWPDPGKVAGYPDSPGLWCGDDILLRLQKSFVTLKAHYFVSAAGLYRLQEDMITGNEGPAPVDGSDGLSINISAGLEARMGKAGYFRIQAAIPLLMKESYPDGLERIFSVMAGIGVRIPE